MVECCFTSTETVGLLGTGAKDGRLDFHTAPELYVGNFRVLEFLFQSAHHYRGAVTALHAEHNYVSKLSSIPSSHARTIDTFRLFLGRTATTMDL